MSGIFGGGQQQQASPTQTQTSYNGISAYAAPYVQNMLGQAQAVTSQPYQAYGGQRTADFTGLQNQAFNSASDLQTPGGYQTGSNLAAMGGIGNLQTTGMAGMYGNMGAQAGMSYGQNATNPNAVAAFMNPYLQNSLQPQLQLLNQQYGQQQAMNQGQATQQGAFGGGRQAVMQGLNQQNQDLATNQLVSNAYNTAYNTAQTNMQNAANLGIQGAQAGLAGIGAQQAGYNNAANAGATSANIAGQNLGAQQNIINQQAAMGGQQQQQQQNVLNQQYQDFQNQLQYPYQQLSYMQNMLSGLPMSSTTQNVYSNPSLLSQVAGLGTTAYALNKMKKGGKVKDRRPGGLGALALSKM